MFACPAMTVATANPLIVIPTRTSTLSPAANTIPGLADPATISPILIIPVRGGAKLRTNAEENVDNVAVAVKMATCIVAVEPIRDKPAVTVNVALKPSIVPARGTENA